MPWALFWKQPLCHHQIKIAVNTCQLCWVKMKWGWLFEWCRIGIPLVLIAYLQSYWNLVRRRWCSVWFTWLRLCGRRKWCQRIESNNSPSLLTIRDLSESTINTWWLSSSVCQGKGLEGSFEEIGGNYWGDIKGVLVWLLQGDRDVWIGYSFPGCWKRIKEV